jgi:hypothetical protein
MLSAIRAKLTYANVMATVAVFVTLGAGAYAAFQLPKNSVKSKNIVNGQVKPADLAKDTGAVAFARVISNGSFDHSRNVSGIDEVSDGVYCINTKVPVRNVIASVNAVSAPASAIGGIVGATLDGGLTCPNKSDVFVRTFNGSGNAAQVPFYVLMH